MSRVFILRHANTFDKGDVITRVGARTDMALSRSGHIQAAQVAHHLADITFERAYCSPLRRTRETAEAVLGQGPSNTTINILEFLTEIDYGQDENRPETEVIARLGQEAINRWDRDAVVPDGWLVNPKSLIQSWRSFFQAMAGKSGDTLVVTSNGIARFALDAVDRLDGTPERKLRTAAYGIVDLNGTQTILTCWNERAEGQS